MNRKTNFRLSLLPLPVTRRAKIHRVMSRLCSSRFERAARKLGWTRIAGIDEAGRGALFGPVVAAAVILNPKRRIVGLDDSKKLAPERRPEHLSGVAPSDDGSTPTTGDSSGLLAHRRHAARCFDRAEVLDQRRCAQCLYRCSLHPGENAPGRSHGRVGRRLSAIRSRAPQRIRHARSPGSVTPARADAAAPPFVRPGARLRVLGRRSDANFTSPSLTAKEQDHRRSCPLPRETPSLQCSIEFSTPDCLLRIQPGDRSDGSSWIFACSLPQNLLRRMGITACSQEVLGSLTWLFPAC